jgi:hypothetical protein
LASDVFHRCQGFASGAAGCGITRYLHRRQAVVAVQLGCAHNPASSGEFGQRNHVATCVPYRQAQDVFRCTARGFLGLHLHPQNPSLTHEIIYIGHAQYRLQGFVQVGNLDTQGPDFQTVDIEEELGRGFLSLRSYTTERRMLGGNAKRHISCFKQLVAA